MTISARFKRSLTLWVGLALAFSYWLVAPFLPTNAQTEWLRVFMIVYAAAAIAAWFPAFREIVLRPSPLAAQQSILGQVMFLSGAFGSAVWLLIWRMAGFPTWMVQSDVNSWFLWLICLGCVFSLIAPKDMTREPPRTRWGRVLWAFVISLVLGYGVVVWRPDVAPLVEWLRTRVSDLTSSPSLSSGSSVVKGQAVSAGRL